MPSRRVFSVLILALGGLGLAAVTVRALEYRDPFRARKDFAITYSAAKALVRGDDPYGPTDKLVMRYGDASPAEASQYVDQPNWHSPFRVVTTVPLTLLPYRAAGIIWELLSAASIVAAAAMFGSALGFSPAASVGAGIAVLALPIVQWDLSWGQVNGPSLLLTVAAWHALRRGKETSAGIALGGAAALRVFPFLLVLPLLGAKKLRAVAITIGVAAILTASCVAIIGLQDSRQLLTLITAHSGHFRAAPFNVSWTGMIMRWFTSNEWNASFHLGWIGSFIAAAGTGVFLAMAILPRARLSGDRFWAAVPLILLAWPIAWDHYLILMLPWFVLAFREATDSARSLLGLSVALCVVGVPRVDAPLGYLVTTGLLLAVFLDFKQFAGADPATGWPAGGGQTALPDGGGD